MNSSPTKLRSANVITMARRLEPQVSGDRRVLARLATLNSIDELWHRLTRPFPTQARRTVNPGYLAAVTGLPAHHLPERC